MLPRERPMVNRHPSKTTRFERRTWTWLACVLLAASSCGGSNAAIVEPVPSLSQTPEGQLAFRELSERWHAARPDDMTLSDDFRRYLAVYGAEDQSRLARAYLAWLEVNNDNLPEARELIEVTRRGPPGRARDFSLVAEAALFVKHGHAHEALKLLRPLQGKIIDPMERYYATQQLVQSAMAANLYAEGLSQAVAWILQAKPQQRDSVRQTIRQLVARVPTLYLEKALQTEKPDPTRHRDPAILVEQQWLYQVIGQQLAALAVQQKDSTLARRILDDGTLGGTPGNRSELVRLASGAGENASVVGHTVGVVLNTRSLQARRRSSQAVTGLSIALRSLQPDTPSHERLELLFADDSIDLTQGLAELAASGASVLATGFDEEEATAAARYAARVRIPVLLFVKPRIATNYAFVLGSSDEEQRRMTRGERDPSAAFVTDLECEVASESTKAAGFPLAKWAAEGRTALYLFGDAACSQRLLTELHHTRFEPEVWLGLESAHLWTEANGARIRTLGAGVFPLRSDMSSEAAAFTAELGHAPTWFETLGRDTALLLEDALSTLPLINTRDGAEVSAYHAQIHSKLAAFQSTLLWSTTADSFDPNMRLQRTLTWR